MLIVDSQGVYGDKETTLARFKENYTSKLTDEMKARLVLENDEVRLAHLLEAHQTLSDYDLPPDVL